MKKTNLLLLLAVGTVGVLALSTKLTAGDDANLPAMSCCGGMAMTTPMADTNTNAVPDLLKTCPVSGDKLGGDMGKPFVMSIRDSK